MAARNFIHDLAAVISKGHLWTSAIRARLRSEEIIVGETAPRISSLPRKRTPRGPQNAAFGESHVFEIYPIIPY